MKILLTLDYELFNGRKSGSVENCLIKPMDELLSVLDKYNFKATLFVDTVFINRARELGSKHPELKEEYDRIIMHLKRLHQQGHELQLHLHPNWLHAKYNDGVWESVLTDYKLSDMSEEDVDRMFNEGIRLLESVTAQKGSVVAYRAGAYCIQTYPNFVKMFQKYGIRIDSSVNRHQRSITKQWQYYDYTQVPKEYSYHFNDDVTKKVSDGRFLEVSIPSYYIPKWKMLQSKLNKKRHGDDVLKWGDGRASINALDGRLVRIYNQMKARVCPTRIVASIDATNGFFLGDIYQCEKSRNDYMLIMGHPKNFTPYSLKCLDSFLRGGNF